jgi:hypothetical protein
MVNYQTSIPAQPAVALQGLMAPPGYVNRDAYDGLMSGVQNNLDRQAQMANAQYMQQAGQAQSQMALRGAQQMAQQRQNAQSLSQARRDQAMSYMNNALRGLFT